MTKPKKLKALFDFLPLPADAFVSRLTAIHDKMLGNTAFPNPPVDVAAFMTAICLMALVQYVANTALAAIASACQINQPIWQTWKKYYLWSSLTYFAGASAAGLIAKLTSVFGFYAVLVTLPIIVIIYFTYRTYLRNIEASITQRKHLI